MRTQNTEYAATSGISNGWGPVLSGAATAFLVFVAFSALWMAIAASGAAWMAGALEWFELGTALGAAAVAGLVTGWLQRGDPGSGAMRGSAAWGLVLLAGLVVGVPSTTAIFAGATNMTLQALTTGGDLAAQLSGLGGQLWVTFIVFAGGGLLAAMTGSATAAMSPRAEPADERVRDDGQARPRDRELAGHGSR